MASTCFKPHGWRKARKTARLSFCSSAMGAPPISGAKTRIVRFTKALGLPTIKVLQSSGKTAVTTNYSVKRWASQSDIRMAMAALRAILPLPNKSPRNYSVNGRVLPRRTMTCFPTATRPRVFWHLGNRIGQRQGLRICGVRSLRGQHMEPHTTIDSGTARLMGQTRRRTAHRLEHGLLLDSASERARLRLQANCTRHHNRRRYDLIRLACNRTSESNIATEWLSLIMWLNAPVRWRHCL